MLTSASVGSRPKRKAPVFLFLLLCISLIFGGSNAHAQGEIEQKVDIRLGQKCSKKFVSRGTKYICLPSARGTKLTWQKYPKKNAPCLRRGLKIKNPAFECVWMTTSGSIQYAKNMWMPPKPPFTYRTVYGDEWQPKIGHECILPRQVLEQSIFQGALRGLYATCLPDGSNISWIWQSGKPAKNKPCALVGFSYEKLMCTKVGKNKKWRPAANGSQSKDSIVAEIFQNESRLGSRSRDSWISDLTIFSIAGMFMELGNRSEIRTRAALAGVKFEYGSDGDPSSNEFSITVDGVKTCYTSEGSDNRKWSWWGSRRDISVAPCDVSVAAAKSRVLAELVKLEQILRTTNDIEAHSVALLRLRSSTTSSYLKSSYSDGRDNLPIEWKFTTDGGGQITSSTYRLNNAVRFPNDVSNVVCYSGTWNGSVSSLQEVACA